MTRTKLSDRQLPGYTRGEELFNFISHIVGGAFAIVATVTCILKAAFAGSAWGVVGASIYGASLIVLYAISSVYHGLRPSTGKKVMQVLDHCAVYFLIGGTYTPIMLCAVRPVHPGWGWAIFGVVWALAAMATVFTAIDLKRYFRLSMICYIAMGWCVILAIRPVLDTVGAAGFVWLLLGGVSYTLGAVLYNIGKRKNRRYMHAVFHVFVLLGSALQYVCILGYVL